MKSETIWDVAEQAEQALRRLRAGVSPEPREPRAVVGVVRGVCRICKRPIHLDLGKPRHTDPLDLAAPNPATDSFF